MIDKFIIDARLNTHLIFQTPARVPHQPFGQIMPRIPIDDNLSIDEDELILSFIRASGPGGQNVNKVSSAVQLRFNVRCSPSLPERVRLAAQKIAGRKLTRNGEIVITANRHRTQPANRRDAMERLVQLLRQAAFRPKFRVKTRLSAGKKKKRLETKARRGQVKRMRSGKIGNGD